MNHADPTPVRRLLSGLVAPATVSTAVLYYFGWLRSQTIAQHFGYEASVLGLGPQDYILRSVQPVATLAIVGGALWWPTVLCHRWISGHLKTEVSPGTKRGELHWITHRRTTKAIQAIGVAASIGALLRTWLGFDTATYLLPGLFALAAGALGYGTWLQGFRDAALDITGFKLSAEVSWTVTAIAMAGLIVLTSIYARQTGRDQAAENIRRTRTAAVVTLVADEPLNLTGLDELTVGDQYLTTGVTLMFTAAGQHFLLPVRYDPDSNARVYVVPVDGVRLDFDRSWEIPCVGFEDLNAGDSYRIGEVFESGGAMYRVLPTSLDRQAAEEPALATVMPAADGLELRLLNVTISPVLQARYDAWLVDYEQHASGAVIVVNHQASMANSFVAVDAGHDGGASVDLTVTGPSEEGPVDGQIRIRGDGQNFTSLAIGGRDVSLDCEPNIGQLG